MLNRSLLKSAVIGGALIFASVALATPARASLHESVWSTQSVRLAAPVLDGDDATRIATEWFRSGDNTDKSKTATFALPATIGERNATTATVVCTAASSLNEREIGNYEEVVAYSTSTCPVAVDYIAAQTAVVECDYQSRVCDYPSYGSLGYDHNYHFAESRASKLCVAGKAYVAIGWHQARLGRSVATATTISGGGMVQFCIQ